MYVAGGLKFALLKDGKIVKSQSETINTHFGILTDDSDFGVFFNPTSLDLLPILKRKPQVVNLWDGMFMIGLSGISSDSIVVEAGAGSGFLTVMIANILSRGKLYAYEIRKDHYDIVKHNLELTGLIDRVELINASVESCKVQMDALFLDLPNPHEIIPLLKDKLKPAGSVVVYVPTVEQVKLVVGTLKEGFITPSVYTLEMKQWNVNPTRPKSKTLAHTGFIVHSKKLR